MTKACDNCRNGCFRQN